MSTDYFWRFNRCGLCERYDEVEMWHSGPSFYAYRHELMNVAYPDWGHLPESPLGRPVLSVADWREVVRDVPGEMWDEYGWRHDDPAGMLATIEPSARGLDMVAEYPDNFYLDAEGHLMMRRNWRGP